MVDRLNIVAHDKFQEIVDAANRPDSMIRLQQVIIEPEDTATRISVVSEPNIAVLLGQSVSGDENTSAGTSVTESSDDETDVLVRPAAPAFGPAEQAIAQLAYKAIQSLENSPKLVPTTSALQTPEVRQLVKEKVEAQYPATQLALEGVADKPNIEAIIAKTTALVIQQTIDIPRIVVVPTGEVKTGIYPLSLDLAELKKQSR